MYEITIQKTFAAAHAIRLPDGSLEPVHGHNWLVEVTISAVELDEIETVMDFHMAEQILDAILVRVHNRHLNEVEPFIGCKVNPTAERVAWWIATSMKESLSSWLQKSLSTSQAADGTMLNRSSHSSGLRGLQIASVRVGEAPGCFAIFRQAIEK